MVEALVAGSRRRTGRRGPGDIFDAAFYKAMYPDVAQFTPARLRRHYERFGRKEGRSASIDDYLARHSPGFEFPANFDARTYLQLNRDLAQMGFSDTQASLHFAEHGARENRRFQLFNPHVYRELYFGEQRISDGSLERHYLETGRPQGRIGSAAELLDREGIERAFWADCIQLQDFALLNWSWAGEVGGYIDAVRLMLGEGIARLAPLSFELNFEADYYREAHPGLSELGDEQLYRHWLWEERAGSPASAGQHLKRLGLSLQSYPTAFRWREYAARRSGLKGRWAALDHLVRTGTGARLDPPIEGDGAASFLVALSRTLASHDDPAALRLLGAAGRLAPLDGSALQAAADCNYRQEMWEEAYDAYRAVTQTPEANLWSFCNAARAALKLGRLDEAFELLHLGQEAYSGEQVWRAVLREAIEAEFQDSWSKAEALYLAGERAQADALMTEAAERSARRWADLDPLGAPLATHPDGRVLILANVDLSQCTHYRVTQKAALLETLGRPYAIYTQAQADAFISALPGASAAIFYRVIANPGNVRAIETARRLGVPTFYDIDDLIFDAEAYPEPRETYASGVTDQFYAMLQLGVPLFRQAMAMCDVAIASTTGLAAHMRKVVRSGQAHVLPNGLDSTNEIYLQQPPRRGRRDGDFVIFYGSGTKAHNSDFMELAGEGLRTAMLCHDHVRLVIVGYLELNESFDALRDRITYIDWVPDVQSYWSILAEADLNIAVLARHATTDAKSEIKWIEAAALGLPSIVSAAERYREVLEDGVDALVAADAADWTRALERMISEPELRERLTANARDKLRRRYTLKANAANLDSLLPKPPAAPSKPAGKKRILLVNIFFPPQSYGGAPRVVRDNLDYFIDHASDRYEFAVLTTDVDGVPAYAQRVESYRGATVFRISVPGRLGMEWFYQDETVHRMFGDILALWEPDLVHFHCVQRLTASVVDVCRERAIPYICTLHDAWWVSDYHFLTDESGRPREPDESLPVDPPTPFSVGDSLARRRVLRPLLEGAQEILGVSKSFTELHRACGYDRAICVANGVPPMPRAVRQASVSGRVRLAQIGSQTSFKGFHHVQAAIRQSAFANLELTVIDHRRSGGPVEEAIWGATPVRYVGKTEQERMQDFYARHDVLLAPSVWPESFGLVSREALQAGLWVLASDRGAIGEDVTPGRNGWIVDVSSPQGVIEALAEINADPQRFLASPPPPLSALRTADDQGRDLLALYADVLTRPRPAPARLDPQPSTPPVRWSLQALEAAERAGFIQPQDGAVAASPGEAAAPEASPDLPAPSTS